MLSAASSRTCGVCSTSYQAVPAPMARVALLSGRTISSRASRLSTRAGTKQPQQESTQGPDFEEMGRKAQAKAKEAFAEFSESARRSYRRLDSEFNLSDKAEKAARRAEEAAKDLDQRYSLRRRLRNLMETVQRKWPTWSKQFSEFSDTWYGKVVIVLGVCILFTSTIFWKVMNVVLLLWWLSVPLSFFLIEAARKRQAERMAAADAAERARNPFADMFRARTSSYRQQAGTSTQASRRYQQQSGPVIDAEWTSIDDDGSKRR